MIMPKHSLGRCTKGSGFTLVELLVVMVLTGIVLTSVYQLLIGFGRQYTKQREQMDVHESLRAAATLLAWEFRQASAADGDLYSINANSVVLRSVEGTGVVCARNPVQPRYGLWATRGNIQATGDDSILVYSAGDEGWKRVKIQQTGAPANLGVGVCGWPGGGVPDNAIELLVNSPADTAGIKIGGPFRVFRRVEYGLYQQDDRWWLGRKVGAAVSYDKLTGPLLSQGSGGLVFQYYDASGSPTTDPTKVKVVEFILRGESFGQPGGGGFQRDSLATKVAVRG